MYAFSVSDWKYISPAPAQGRIELTDENTKDDLKFDFEGVHFMPNGSIYGFAEPSGCVHR